MFLVLPLTLPPLGKSEVRAELLTSGSESAHSFASCSVPHWLEVAGGSQGRLLNLTGPLDTTRDNNDPRLLETLKRLNDLMHIKRLDPGPKQALHNCSLVFYRSKKILLAFIQPVLLLFTKKGVVAPQFFFGFLPILHLFHTVTWFPTFLAQGTGFVEDNFSARGGSRVEGVVWG